MGDSPGHSITSVVRNSENLTSKWSVFDTNFCYSDGYFLQSPSVGTFNCVVSYSGGIGESAATAIPIANCTGVAGIATNFVPAAGSVQPAINEPVFQGVFDLVIAHLFTDTATGVLPLTGVQVDQINNIGSDTSQNVVKIDSGGYVRGSWSQGADPCAMGIIVLQGAQDAFGLPVRPVRDTGSPPVQQRMAA